MKTFNIIKLLILVAVLATISGCQSSGVNQNSKTFTPAKVFETPERLAGQTHLLELRPEPIETVHMAILCLGMRGYQAVFRYTNIKGAKIVALADVVPEKVDRANKLLKENNLPQADEYTGAEAWKTICEREDIDLIYVTTHWELHTPIAVYAM